MIQLKRFIPIKTSQSKAARFLTIINCRKRQMAMKIFNTNGISYQRTNMLIRYYASSQKQSSQDTRKLLEICQSVLPSLMHEGDFTAVIDFIGQVVSVLVSSLFERDKSQSKKVVKYIFEVLQQMPFDLNSNQAESTLQILYTLSTNIQKINEIDVIIGAQEYYLSFHKRYKAQRNLTYVEILSKLAQNCIFAQEFQLALQYLRQIQIIARENKIDVGFDLQIQNLINLGLSYLSLGQIQQSISIYQKALEHCSLHGSENSNQSYKIAILQCIGDIQMDRKFIEAALKHYQSALNIIKEGGLKTSIHSIILSFKISRIHFKLKKYQSTIALCVQIEKDLQLNENLKEQFEYQNQCILLIAQSEKQLKNYAQAIVYYKKYALQAEKSFALDEERYISVLKNLISLYEMIGSSQLSLDYLKSLSKYYKREGKDEQHEQCLKKITVIQSKAYI